MTEINQDYRSAIKSLLETIGIQQEEIKRLKEKISKQKKTIEELEIAAYGINP